MQCCSVAPVWTSLTSPALHCKDTKSMALWRRWSVPVAPGACILLASIPTKRPPVGRDSVAARGSLRHSRAFPHGPQARKRSATDGSGMDSYRAVQVPATSRKDLSNPHYKQTTRKSCTGVLPFLARPNALHARAICTVSAGRSCQRSSQSVAGSVRGHCMSTSPVGSRGKVFLHAGCPHFL